MIFANFTFGMCCKMSSLTFLRTYKAAGIAKGTQMEPSVHPSSWTPPLYNTMTSIYGADFFLLEVYRFSAYAHNTFSLSPLYRCTIPGAPCPNSRHLILQYCHHLYQNSQECIHLSHSSSKCTHPNQIPSTTSRLLTSPSPTSTSAPQPRPS